MLKHYLVEYCTPATNFQDKAKFMWKYPRSIYTGTKLIRMEGVDVEVIERIAKETVGFSGRAINKMVVAWHDAAFALPDPVLTPDIMDRILEKFKLQQKLKDTWSRDEANLYGKMLTLDNDMTGSAEVEEEKSESMKKAQDEIMAKIESERMGIKEMRGET